MISRIVKSGIAGLCLAALSFNVMGQVITFNSPAPWLTLRNDSLIVKAQLDTAKFTQKKITFTVTRYENKVKKPLPAKTLKVSDFTQDFFLGMATPGIIGGNDFIKIEWAIPGSVDKGYCAPVGIVGNDRITKIQPMHVVKSAAALDIKNVAEIIKDRKFVKVADKEFLTVWNSEGLGIIIKRTGKDKLTFTLDGKNGKNAFVSYSDKMIDYFSGNDSMYAYVNERGFASDTIYYTPKTWVNDIVKTSDKDYVMVKISWYDIGIAKTFEGRMLGFAAFGVPAKGPVAGFPDKAQLYIPGLWGNIVLDK
jgi:hypothetical protein